MEHEMKKTIWIGMVQVKPLPGSATLKGDVGGAFVNVLTWATNRSEFREKAEELMDYLSLEVTGVEDEEPLREREKKNQPDAAIAQVALEMQGNPQAIRYMTFHTWTAAKALTTG